MATIFVRAVSNTGILEKPETYKIVHHKTTKVNAGVISVRFSMDTPVVRAVSYYLYTKETPAHIRAHMRIREAERGIRHNCWCTACPQCAAITSPIEETDSFVGRQLSSSVFEILDKPGIKSNCAIQIRKTQSDSVFESPIVHFFSTTRPEIAAIFYFRDVKPQ